MLPPESAKEDDASGKNPVARVAPILAGAHRGVCWLNPASEELD